MFDFCVQNNSQHFLIYLKMSNSQRIKKMQHRVTRLLDKKQHARNKLDSRRTDRSRKHRQYAIEDVHRGLRKMVEGDSARKASLYTHEQGCRVPFNTLKDLFLSCFGFSANSRVKLSANKQKEMLGKVGIFCLPGQGPDAYFWEDEEEIIMKTLEFAHSRGFPYDEDNLIMLTTAMLQVTMTFCTYFIFLNLFLFLQADPKYKKKNTVPTRNWATRNR